MHQPLCSVIIPTIGRETLERTLRSIRVQAPAQHCELIVVGDTHAGTWRESLRPVPALCDRYAARYHEYDGGEHMVGQPQRNYGMTVARGRWLLFSQDDAAWAEAAWAGLEGVLRHGLRRPHIFQVATWQAGVVPKRHVIRLGNVDADCIAAPNDARRLGQWGLEYAGDFVFIRDTCALYPDGPVWVDNIIAVGRPSPSRDWGAGRVAVAG